MNNNFGEFAFEVIRFSVAFILLVAGVVHIADPYDFAVAIARYNLVTPKVAGLLSTILPLGELVVGVFLLARFWVSASLIVAGMMFAAFSTAVFLALRQGLDISCGCMGVMSPKITNAHVWLTGLFSLVCFLALFRSVGSVGPDRLRRYQKGGGRTGFSLVELICVIALIGILVGMLLPAIQSVRGAARRITCKNNLRQLALAALNYESSNGVFPPGTIGFKGTVHLTVGDLSGVQNDPSHEFFLYKNQNTSWIVHLLDFLEQGSLSDQLPPICTKYSSDYQTYRSGNGGPIRLHEIPEVSFIMSHELPVLLCPSDDLVQSSENIIGSQPAYLLDENLDGFMFTTTNGFSMGGTNFSACSGAYSGGNVPDPGMQKYDGIFGSRIRKGFRELRDGASNSILIGETLGSIVGKERTYMNPWFFSTMCRGRSDLNWRTSESSRSPGLELLGDDWFAYQSGFASVHPSTVNFSRADGSVMSLSRSIEWPVLYALCGIRDGEDGQD